MSTVPLILWIVVVVLALGWLILLGALVKLNRRVNVIDGDLTGIDRDLGKVERAMKAQKIALEAVQRAQAAQTNPMMPVVRPDVPPGRHSRFRQPPPRAPYA